MRTTLYNQSAAKRPVNLSLNEDLVRRARELSPNLSAMVEQLLAEHLRIQQDARRADDEALEHTIDYLNEMHTRYGTLSEEFGQI